MLAEPTPGWGSWGAHPLTIGWLVLVTVVYIRCYRRAGRYSSRSLTPHLVAFSLGLIAVAVALLSPLDPVGDRWLLSAHVLQHVLLADIAPALIVLGWRAPVLPLGLSPRILRVVAPGGQLGRRLAWLRNGWLAATIWAAVQLAWGVPVLFDAAAASAPLHVFEHLTLLGSGLLLWWAVIDPLPGERRRPAWSRLGYLGLSRAAAAAICLPLTWLGSALYPRYAEAPRAYGISALRDQQIAGASMCLIELLVFGVAFMVVFLDLLSREERATAVAERAASAPLRRVASSD